MSIPRPKFYYSVRTANNELYQLSGISVSDACKTVQRQFPEDRVVSVKEIKRIKGYLCSQVL